MPIQKGSLNGIPIVEDSSNPGVPVIDVDRDGGDIVAGVIAHVATARPTMIVSNVEVMKALSSPYLIDGQTYQTLSYVSGLNIGGNTYTYDSDGAIPDDSGLIINHNVAGQFLAIDQTQAKFSQYGVTFDGSTNDSVALQAAFDAGVRLFGQTGICIIDTELSQTHNDQIIDGGEMTIKATGEVDWSLVVTGKRANINYLNIDGNVSGITLSSKRGEGIRVSADDVVLNDCQVSGNPIGGTANGIFCTNGTNRVVLNRCRAIDPGYACYRIDSKTCTLNDCEARIVTDDGDSMSRWLVSNSDVDDLRWNGGTWFCNVPIQTNVVIDFNGADANAKRRVYFDGLTIDHPNWVKIEGASQIIKLEDVYSCSMSNVTSNATCAEFMRLSNVDFDPIEQVVLRDCNVTGQFIGNGRNYKFNNCIIHADTDLGTSYVLQANSTMRNVLFENCIIDGFLAMQNTTPTYTGHFMSFKDTEWIHRSTSNGFIFVYLTDARSLHLENFKITEQNTGRAYLSSSTEGRLLATGKRGELHYNFKLAKYYNLPINSHTGQTGDDRCGTRSTQATTSVNQRTADITVGNSAFTNNGQAGDIIWNDEPSNQYGLGWIHDDTDWVPLVSDERRNFNEVVTGTSPTLVTYGVSVLNGSSNGITGTLGDGTYYGREKTVIASDISNVVKLSVTNHVSGDPTLYTFNNVGDFVKLINIDGSTWSVIAATATID